MPNKRYDCILCGDLNFHSKMWHTLLSNIEEESQIIDLLDSNMFQQEIKLPTWSCNTLDVAFWGHIAFSAEVDENFSEVYDCSDHVAIKLSVGCSSRYPNLSYKISGVSGLRTTQGCEILWSKEL